MNKQMQEHHALLIEEFNQYLFDHPEFLEQIPQGAVIVLQLKGDEEYNRWSRRTAQKTREKGQPLAVIEIQKLAPARSRLVEPHLRLEAVP